MRVLDDDVDDSAYLFDWDAAPPKETTGFWNAFRVTTLTTLWHAGVVTREIGAQLGCTKNAVIGKADRLGLPRRERELFVVRKSRKHKRGRGIKCSRKRKRA